MDTSIRDLRKSLKATLDIVKKGQDVIVYSRNEKIARITQVKKNAKKEDIGFGMWANEEGNVIDDARQLRKGRRS